jgi:L-asparaginase
MTLRIVAAGGTFDKHYDAISGCLTFADSHLPLAVQQSRIGLPVIVESLPLMDSLDMQEGDRQRIVDACRVSPETMIIIVHGTDTMVETARALAKANIAKTIILTGAMIPFEIAHSDALFNLGFACAAVQTLTMGVYVSMNATVFAWDRVRKNRAAGLFEAV